MNRARRDLLHVFALCSFAITQPLLDLLARNAELFVARRSQPLDVALLVAILVFAPALLISLLRGLAGLASPRMGRAVQRVAIAALVAAVALPWTNRWIASGRPPSSPLGSIALAVAIGIGALGVYGRARIARQILSVLAAAPLVFVGAFAASDPIRALWWPAPETARTAAPRDPAPIVFVIFDELPLASLLDEKGGIDAVAFPNFARLAATSTWLRNASSVEARTLQSIPALLSGRYPDPRRNLPIAAHHPQTLFALLADHYALNVAESLTNLYDGGEASLEPFAQRFAGLSSDTWLVYAHTLVPIEWSGELPSISHSWRDFGGGSSEGPRRGLRARPTLFRQFVASIQPGPVAKLHFIHSVLPHGPWQYLPSGNTYSPHTIFGRFLGTWSDVEHFVADAHWRHLLQTELVDRLLGELLDRLQNTGQFDASIVVVSADHGASFWSNDHYRNFDAGRHPADILAVPLFIKRPHQRVGVVDRSNVETVDVVPSLLDLIDAPVPLGVDGCSVFDPTCPERADKTAFSAGPGGGVRHRFPADLGLDPPGRRLKLTRFGAGAERGPDRQSPHADWIGRKLDDFEVAPAAFSPVRLESARRSWQIGPDEALVPVRVVGSFASPEPDTEIDVAIAVGGVIQAVVPTPVVDERHQIVALLPESAVDPRAKIDLLAVTGPDSLSRLEIARRR